MKTYDEMVNSLLKRREEFLSEQKKKRRTAVKITAAGSCCVLAAVIGAGILNSGMPLEKEIIIPDHSSAISDDSSTVSGEPATANPTPQAPDYSSVIWAEGGFDDGSAVDTVISETSELNGKRIYHSLSEAFDKYGNDSVFAIAAYSYGYDDNFVYNGKTLAQHEAEERAAWDKYELRYQLLKFSDLKYGEALYLTGTPDGERWAKEYYDEIVSMFGQELISEYIVDGEFLEDKLTEDVSESENEYMAVRGTYEQGRIACNKYIYETGAEQISAQGIYCETKYSSDYPYLLVIFVTKDEFETLSFVNMNKWGFALAQKNENGFYASDFIIDCEG